MKIDILTLFPDMFVGPFSESIIKRAQGKTLVDINLVNFRDFAEDKHKSVDDTPYGGGVGMVLKVDILVKALEATINRALPKKHPDERIILLSPKGTYFTQAKASEYATLTRLTLVSGHYEDFDARIEHFVDEVISIGDYVLTGGEIPAMVITDSVVRLLPGVITEGSTTDESFADGETIEYPQYTRPLEFRGLLVPEVLRSGDHQTIKLFRDQQKRKRIY